MNHENALVALRIDWNDANDGLHTFCGPNRIPGADCPNCSMPLQHFLTLDMSDPFLAGMPCDLDSLPLLFCWECEVSQHPFFYSVDGNGRCEVISYGRGDRISDFPYLDYPREFPMRRARLVAKGPGQSEDGTPMHQVGGPFMLHDPDRVLACPRCHGRLEVFATIADDCADPRGFVGNAFVQVVYGCCGECRVLGCYQEVD